jgi:thioredoxin reductase
MHGYLGHEGVSPVDFSAIGRAEVRSYGVEILTDRAVDVTRTGDKWFRFRVELASGHTVLARRVLAATGLADLLPEIPGAAEHWGRDVIHCPFCHGFEVRDQRIVQIVTHPSGLHPAAMFRQLTDRFTMVLHEDLDGARPEVDALRAAGVNVVARAVSSIVTDDRGRVAAVELQDGDRIDADAVVVGVRFRVQADVFGSLGLEPVEHPSGLGDFVETDETGETSVPGLYAAGNLTDPNQQVLQAAANGSRVGAVISFGLAHEDIELAARPSAGEADWDHRYSDDQIWSGDPNPTLLSELEGVVPGRALDVGAGEGGDAIWLAEQGWKVTASDISQRALDRVAAEGARRGVEIEGHRSDANALAAFHAGAFDLVTAHYVPIPRTPDRRGARNLLEAVAPGGTLLFVSHDLEPMRASGDTNNHHPYDPDAYLNVADFVDVLEGSSEWEIKTHETRARPAAKSSPHINDIVLRAQHIG